MSPKVRKICLNLNLKWKMYYVWNEFIFIHVLIQYHKTGLVNEFLIQKDTHIILIQI